MAGGIAHDFNNILGAILGYGELAREIVPADGAAHRHIENVMRAAERGRLLVDRILAFSRSEIGDLVPVNVAAVIEEALEMLRPSLDRNVRIEKDLRTREAIVTGDTTRIHQIVTNLCINGAQAMRSGGILRVRLEHSAAVTPRPATRGIIRRGGYVLLTVTDIGTGISPSILGRIFDPFFTTKLCGEGSGLGLAMVDGIVHDLGGAMDVVTRRGRGTSFKVWLPAGRRTSAPPARRS